MRVGLAGTLIAGLLVIGCAEPGPAGGSGQAAAGGATTSNAGEGDQAERSGDGSTAKRAELPPLGAAEPEEPANTRQLKLSSSNTLIQFVCAHVGDDPNPRTGRFERFSGVLTLDPQTKQLQAVSLEIETASITTEIQRLTNHLKSPDFFDVRRFPTAAFQSAAIVRDENNENAYTITGELTLHGVTQQIEIPATVTVDGAKVEMESQFTINRTQFAMTWGPDRVEEEVEVTVVIGDGRRA